MAGWHPYARRNQILRDMGFGSYEAYLKSPPWYAIQRRVLARFGHQCQACGRRATQVHHKTYSKENLSGTTIAGMIAVCRPCHESAEVQDGVKATLEQANKFLELEGKLNNVPPPVPSCVRPTKKRKLKSKKKHRRVSSRATRLKSQMAQDRAFHERMCSQR